MANILEQKPQEEDASILKFPKGNLFIFKMNPDFKISPKTPLVSHVFFSILFFQ